MTMDLKDIIKWFIPCFHILLAFLNKSVVRLTFVCVFLFLIRPGSAAKVFEDSVDISNSFNDNDTKNVEISSIDNFTQSNQSEELNNLKEENGRLYADTSVGRTFGRPFKKMIQAFIPLAFQMGAAATWAVVAALVGIKTLGVTLLILKLLLIAGAAKIGALFGAHKGGHQSHDPHQKEIHLHIHNGGHHGVSEEHIPISPWSRDGVQTATDNKQYNLVLDPYAAGPQTISTPYGNYMKIEANNQLAQ